MQNTTEVTKQPQPQNETLQKFLTDNEAILKDSKQRILDVLQRENMDFDDLTRFAEADLRDILRDAKMTAIDRARFIATMRLKCPQSFMFEQYKKQKEAKSTSTWVHPNAQKSSLPIELQPLYAVPNSKMITVPLTCPKFDKNGNFNLFYDMQAPTLMKSVEERTELLLLSIVRRHTQAEEFSTDIMSVIVRFAGPPIIFVFDTVQPKYANVVQHRGTYVRRPDRYERFTLPKFLNVTVGSSKAFSEWFTQFSVKVIRARADIVGITSDLAICRDENLQTKWVLAAPGNIYGYHGRDDLLKGALKMGNKTKPKPPQQAFDKVETNDIVSVKVDVKAWTVSFYRNGKMQGKPVDIAPNYEYYPFIGTQNHDCDHQIMYDYRVEDKPAIKSSSARPKQGE
mmetsp:Transcript_46303/g.76970  ORF Transcript_46303/g.76970 Transcript_46303/m.76970 type:complete len:398 (+) Transcript_46303:3-1196(+)